MKTALLLPPLVFWSALAPAVAASVRVRNDFGSIAIHSEPNVEKTEVQATLPTRALRPDDVTYSQERGIFRIECQPADGVRIDLDVTVPHTTYVEVISKTGAVSVTGLIRDVSVVTDSSPVKLVVPWRLVRIRLMSVAVPLFVKLPALDYAEFPSGVRQGYWSLVDAPPGFTAHAPNPKEPLRSVPDLDRGLPLRGWLYGSLRIRGNSIQRIELEDQPLTAHSWIKPPDLAPAILDGLLGVEAKAPAPPGPAAPPPDPGPVTPDDRLPVFVSDVRMVNLVGPLYDDQGRPVPGLGPEDFEVAEEGAPQRVALAASEEVPFNLILLLDFSTTALRERYVLEEAARGFLGIARPQDRVAVYALAEGLFQVISPLTPDRQQIMRQIDAMPQLGGTSPIYDALVLAYSQENLQATRERTAVVLISDGIDNTLHGSEGGSKSSYEKLLRFVSGTPVLIYPIVLPPPTMQRPFPASKAVVDAAPEARRRLQQLADATGGRLFTADSTFNMRPVYPLVAQELERVYTIAYYPQNQNFDGRWRRVKVQVKRPGVTFRTRDGYYSK